VIDPVIARDARDGACTRPSLAGAHAPFVSTGRIRIVSSLFAIKRPGTESYFDLTALAVTRRNA
jgi:hypothetical protein